MACWGRGGGARGGQRSAAAPHPPAATARHWRGNSPAPRHSPPREQVRVQQPVCAGVGAAGRHVCPLMGEGCQRARRCRATLCTPPGQRRQGVTALRAAWVAPPRPTCWRCWRRAQSCSAARQSRAGLAGGAGHEHGPRGAAVCGPELCAGARAAGGARAPYHCPTAREGSLSFSHTAHAHTHAPHTAARRTRSYMQALLQQLGHTARH